jgi:hypothetical protein
VNSSAFDASRVALVATNLTLVAPESAIALAYSPSIAKVLVRASGASLPVASTPWPSRTISILRCTSVS